MKLCLPHAILRIPLRLLLLYLYFGIEHSFGFILFATFYLFIHFCAILWLKWFRSRYVIKTECGILYSILLSVKAKVLWFSLLIPLNLFGYLKCFSVYENIAINQIRMFISYVPMESCRNVNIEDEVFIQGFYSFHCSKVCISKLKKMIALTHITDLMKW